VPARPRIAPFRNTDFATVAHTELQVYHLKRNTAKLFT
jgi:hypothetical protein